MTKWEKEYKQKRRKAELKYAKKSLEEIEDYLIKEEATKRYGGASFGNDMQVFIEGATWANNNLN